MDRSRMRRGLAILAVAALAVAVVRRPPKVFNQRAPELQVACPTGTTPLAGACLETTPRGTANFYEAAEACTAAGRRLPTVAQLWGYQAAGGDLSGDESAFGEGTSGLDWDGGPNPLWWSVRDDDSHWIDITPVERAFRCVAPLTN
jgi:hypothetical protein